MSDRKWHKGPPPHVGWWNASVSRSYNCWRWWDGEQRSLDAYPGQRMPLVESRARISDWSVFEMEWTTYWPINGRVPRINPQTGEVTGRIK